jgi:hypothetical protein
MRRSMKRANLTSRYAFNRWRDARPQLTGARNARVTHTSVIRLEPIDTLPTPYAAIVAGFRRTESLCDRPILSTRRPSTGITGRSVGELENREGVSQPLQEPLRLWRSRH